jgi:hypothetical protein
MAALLESGRRQRPSRRLRQGCRADPDIRQGIRAEARKAEEAKRLKEAKLGASNNSLIQEHGRHSPRESREIYGRAAAYGFPEQHLHRNGDDHPAQSRARGRRQHLGQQRPSPLSQEEGPHQDRERRLRDRAPLEYAENATYTRYSGYDTLNTSASDVLSAAKYDWCQSAIHVVASGRELRMNNGPEAMIKLVKARIKNATHTASNNLAADLYSDGTATNQINGLANLIQSSGTGTVGGIVSGTYTFWKNQFSEVAGTNTWSKSTIKGEMNKLWYPCVRGNDKPDLIISRRTSTRPTRRRCRTTSAT